MSTEANDVLLCEIGPHNTANFSLLPSERGLRGPSCFLRARCKKGKTILNPAWRSYGGFDFAYGLSM
ncbi:MAG: hypothetical protein QW808_01170 [Desulfurococcaceae archaeon]